MEEARMQGWGLRILQVVVGIVFVIHRGQKLFLMEFGGMADFLGSLGVPVPELFAVIVTLVELLSGLALILGFFARVAAGLLAVDMLVAILTVHYQMAFWYPIMDTSSP